MRVRITDYSQDADLYDAITRYSTLLQMTFVTNIYKVIETVDAQIYRFVNVGAQPGINQDIGNIVIDFECNHCKHISKIQANLKNGSALKNEHIPFPKDNKYFCPKCHKESDLSDLRREIEIKTKKNIVSN